MRSCGVMVDGTKPVQELVEILKKRRIMNSLDLAFRTYDAFVELINKINWVYPSELFGILRSWASQVSQCCRPHAIVAENVALRILKIVSDVLRDIVGNFSEAEEDSLHLLLRGKFRRRDDSLTTLAEDCVDRDIINQFLTNLHEELQSFRNELETSLEDITRQALQHIHSNETVMVFGYSRTIEAFLRAAAKRRKFRLIVAEGSPNLKGHVMVKRMAALGIEITLIPDSTIFAIMARVNKVIIGACSICADGSLCTLSGTSVLALSAKHHGVPVLVCSSLYKLSARYNHVSSVSGRDVDDTMPLSPESVLDFYTAGTLGDIEVINPTYDHVPPDMVTLFITNIGAQSPSYMYRILKEIYHPDDLAAFE